MQLSIRSTLVQPASCAGGPRLEEPAGSPGKVDDLAGLAREASRPGAQPPALPHPPADPHPVGAYFHLPPPSQLPPNLHPPPSAL